MSGDVSRPLAWLKEVAALFACLLARAPRLTARHLHARLSYLELCLSRFYPSAGCWPQFYVACLVATCMSPGLALERILVSLLLKGQVGPPLLNIVKMRLCMIKRSPHCISG